MAPSVSKEELMRKTDSVIWGFSGGTVSPELGTTEKVLQEIWRVLNSRLCNGIVVVLVVVEGVIVLAQLLIDLNLLQDPDSTNHNCSSVDTNYSPRMKKTKDAFAVASLTLLVIFAFEVLLRIIAGKTQFIVRGIEVFDAIVVLITFGLDLAFFISPSDVGVGKRCAIFIILLRLWRVGAIFKSVIATSKAKLNASINAYQRDKVHSDHKVDLLILKVEDLEHEVAYLKERLKKTEPPLVKRRRAKETPTLVRQTPHSPFHPADAVGVLACRVSALIVDEALLLAAHIRSPRDLPMRTESGYASITRGSLKCPQESSSPESGYGSAHNPCTTVFLFPNALDEGAEIERIRRVDFDRRDKDLPMTSL